jgi:hypothetical protein
MTLMKKTKTRKFIMYDKYIKANKAWDTEDCFGDYYKDEEEKWMNSYYGDIPSLIPITPVESVFVLNARKSKTAPLAVLFALIVTIFVALGIIVQKGRIGHNDWSPS